MKKLLSLALMTTALFCRASDLPRSTPEAEGISSAAILEFVEAAEAGVDSLHSFMLVRHGKVVAEGWWAPYHAQAPHELYSLSKSFTSTAVGMAIAEGKFSLDDEVLKFFPEHAPAEPGRNLRSMRVRDLLRMNTGHEKEPSRPADSSWKREFLHQPVSFKPGTHFLYNTPATYMLSAIVEKTAGTSLVEYLRPRLFESLGIENPVWDRCPEGTTLGGYGLSVRTEDIARFGQLYLQKGTWKGKQLIPASWVEQATAFQTSNGSSPGSDWDQGYGYQFWRCRHGAYRGDGAFGQYCIVMPKQEAVIAITSGLGDMQSVLNLVWDKLLPAMSPEALPANGSDQANLKRKLAGLTLRPQQGSNAAPQIFGKRYRFESNPQNFESLTLERDADGATIRVQAAGKETRVRCGNGSWSQGEMELAGKTQPIAASGAWSSADTFTAKICFYHTPFIHTLRLTFSGEELRLNSEANVGFGPTKQPELRGKL